jgi:hypothetical protein
MDEEKEPDEFVVPEFGTLPASPNLLQFAKAEDAHAPNSIFICYHNTDLDFAFNGLRPSLIKGDRIIWMDTQEPSLSAEWLDLVHKGIENTDVFIFLLSPASNDSKACAIQLQHAVKNGKRIIPVCCKKLDYRKVIHELAVVNWIMMGERGPNAREEFFAAAKLLVNTVEKDKLHVQYHTKILRRAIEWERYDFEKSLLLSGSDLSRAQHWLSAAALGKEPKPTTLHLSFITASASLNENMKRRRTIAMFFAVIVIIGIIWPSWGVFFFSLVFSHFFVYFSSS